MEWPPSPWQLLGAVAAGWHATPRSQYDVFLRLLDRLAAPPRYLLPHATAGYTRSHMPLGSATKSELQTELFIDSTIALEKYRGSVTSAYVIWPEAELSEDECDLLDECCTYIGYIGRAESCCAITVVDSAAATDGFVLVDLASRSQRDGPTVRRLAPSPDLRGEALLASLSATTSNMRKSRGLVPRGGTWLDYRLPPEFLMVPEQFYRPERSKAVFGPTMLRFSVEGGEHSPRPTLKDAVVFAELLRAAAIKHLSNLEGEPATHRLAGKAQDGSPREGHDHPYFLPFGDGCRGEIDGIDIWFPQGCTHAEYRAVTSVIELHDPILYRDKFLLTFIGRVRRTRASRWRSATPIILDRFPKVRGTNGSRRVIDAPEEQIASMLGRRVANAARIELWPPGRGIERAHGGSLRINAFRRTRIRKPSPPLPAVAATVHFDEPVEGPIILGRLAHFGLGRFEPI